MTKRKITEHTLYTAEELDTIHEALVTENTVPIYHPQDVIRRMVVFTSKLHGLLVQEGFTCTYNVMTRYSQLLEIHLDDNQTHVVVLDLFSIYSGYKLITSIQELVEHLHYLRDRYLQVIAARHEMYLLISQCRGCHYSDERVEFCGKGLSMALHCKGYQRVR